MERLGWLRPLSQLKKQLRLWELVRCSSERRCSKPKPFSDAQSFHLAQIPLPNTEAQLLLKRLCQILYTGLVSSFVYGSGKHEYSMGKNLFPQSIPLQASQKSAEEKNE
jgi:hypothetical protein